MGGCLFQVVQQEVPTEKIFNKKARELRLSDAI